MGLAWTIWDRGRPAKPKAAEGWRREKCDVTFGIPADFIQKNDMTKLTNGHLSHEHIHYCYTVGLPLIWMAVMVSLWSLVWGVRDGWLVGEIASGPGSLLPGALKLEGFSFVVVQIAVGIPIMAALGLLQDYLRMPPVWAWGYLAGFVFGMCFWMAGMGTLLADVLFWGCIGLYVVSVLLCLVSSVLHLRLRRALAVH